MSMLHSPLGTRKSLVYKSFGSPSLALRLAESDLHNLRDGNLRVAMSLAAVNPSDLIPITGAYAHRIRLPATAGYEGVGHVIQAPPDLSYLVGKRVLPLRGEGTWQTVVDCLPDNAIPIPDNVPDEIAARAYINPLAAHTMLDLWDVRGKTVLLSGAGSSCAEYLGRWAYQRGAAQVYGVYRSESRAGRMKSLGIDAISIGETARLLRVATQADVTFDALGGTVASEVLASMQAGSTFIGYGLLTGRAVSLPANLQATYRRFHLRDHLGSLPAGSFSASFLSIWPMLMGIDLPEICIRPAHAWKEAIIAANLSGSPKQLLDFQSLA